MKQICFFLLLLTLNLNVVAQSDSLLLKFEHYTLKNGLNVILQCDKNVNDVSVEFWLKDGIRIDKPHQYGLSHFFEHVMPFSQMDSLKRKKLASYMTGSNAQVKKDYSRFYIKVKPEGLNLALERVSGRLNAGSENITKNRIEFQRKRVLSEIDKNSKNPMWSAQGGMAIYKGTFGENHPYGSSVYGLIENNKKFQLEDFKKRYNEIVYANNIILFLVGNFDIEEAKKHINTHFSDIPSRAKQFNKVKSTSHLSKKLTLNATHPNDTLNTLVLSWAIPKWGNQDDGTLKLIANILNNRLKEDFNFSKLIVKSDVDTDMYRFAGQFLIKTTYSSAKDSSLVENLIYKKLNNFFEKSITKKEITNAKQKEKNNIIDMHENLGFQWSRTELLGEGLLFTGDPSSYFKRLERLLKLSEKDIKKCAKKWLVKKPFRLLFVSNKE